MRTASRSARRAPTTTRARVSAPTAAVRRPAAITTPPRACQHLQPRRVARRAVATLGDAWQAAGEAIDHAWGPYAPRPTTSILDDAKHYDFRAAALRIPESGGAVGPLPDGTVIEVAQIGWTTIYAQLRPVPPERPLMDWTAAEVIAAFNEKLS